MKIAAFDIAVVGLTLCAACSVPTGVLDPTLEQSDEAGTTPTDGATDVNSQLDGQPLGTEGAVAQGGGGASAEGGGGGTSVVGGGVEDATTEGGAGSANAGGAGGGNAEAGSGGIIAPWDGAAGGSETGGSGLGGMGGTVGSGGTAGTNMGGGGTGGGTLLDAGADADAHADADADAAESEADVCAPPCGEVFALNVGRLGAGNGIISSNDARINCGTTCSAAYLYGSNVVLTATPATGSRFTGWSGGGCTGTATCTVSITAVNTVRATFALQAVALTLAKAGTGTGAITSSPTGINCGTACSASFPYGTNVALTATPATGSLFSSWSDRDCSTNPVCTVPMTAARNITATFRLQQYTLTVNRAGTGTGSVTLNPGSITCTASCSTPFNYGTTVTLSAKPAADSVFSGWSGACSGTGTCSVQMTAARTVTANYARGTLSCTSVNNADSCTDGSIPEINLGAITAATCRAQCQTAMFGQGMARGCWILASNNTCYCRSGTLNLVSTGTDRPGGTCTR